MRLWIFPLVVMLLGMPSASKAEIDSCNSPKVKTMLLSRTFGKWKETTLAKLNKANGEVILKRQPFVCPAYSPPDPRSFAASPNNAPYVKSGPRAGQPMTPDDFRQEHARICALRTAQAREQEDTRERDFKERKLQIVKNMELLERVEATLANVRQAEYDRANDARSCAAEFEYQNYPSEAGRFRAPECEKLVLYRIERLLDKPDSFYLSWQCF